MKSNLGDLDMVKVYLNQMSAIPPISHDEEKLLAGDLEQARMDYQRAILGSPVAVREALGWFAQVLAGELQADRVFLMDLREATQRRDLLSRLRQIVEAVPPLLAETQDIFVGYLDDDATPEDKGRLRKTIKVGQATICDLLTEHSLQLPRLEQLVGCMRDVFEDMKTNRRLCRKSERASVVAARAQLKLDTEFLALQQSAQQNLRGMRKKLCEIGEVKKQYEIAKQRLGRKNLRLVVSIAKKFRNKGLPFLDLIQEGNTGLMKALDRYQASRGNKFSTYATWWIKQTITRSIAYQSRTVRIPIHAINNLNVLIEQRESFIKREGRDPTDVELATLAGITPAEVRRLLDLQKASLSIDQPYGSEEDGLFGDVIEDESLITPIEETQFRLLRDEIGEVLKSLSHREREVLKLRFGLIDGSTRTLEEVGAVFKVSRERIRQIEVGALQKLKLPERRERLHGFWRECNDN